MDKLQIKNIKIEDNRIDVFFNISESLEKYFNGSKHFWVEYSIPLDGVPISVAIIPFICNVLPIIWITNSELELKELDKTFFDSIKDFKEGYINMYPTMEFGGKVSVEKLIDNNCKTLDKTALLFSGGVDAFSSLVGLVDRNPELVTIWGADITESNSEAWRKIDTHIKEVSKEFNLEYRVIRSNLRTFIDNSNLSTLIVRSGDNYWHGFQHGIGMLGLTAPYASKQGIKNIYISSSFSEEIKKASLLVDKKTITCASDPSIDNYVKFGETSVIHYQYEMSRQDKLRNICLYSQNSTQRISLRVCWESALGDNCCKCEKCYRTICGLWAEGADPVNYGFDIGHKNFSSILISNLKKKNIRPINWKIIQNRSIENIDNIKEKRFKRWIVKANFDKFNNSFFKMRYRIIKKFKRIIKNI